MEEDGEPKPEVDPLLVAVGERIRDLRVAADIAPVDFARRAGFGLPYLWRLQKGQQNISLRSLSRIALALDVPMAALVEGIAADPRTLVKRSWTPRPAAGGPTDGNDPSGE